MFFILIMFSGTALSQGSIQLTLTGVPPILPSPMIADIERNFHQGHYMMQVQYSNTNPEPVAFYYELALLRYNEELFRTISQPVYYSPGTYIYRQLDDDPPISFPEDLSESLFNSLGESLIREGMLPEGDYTLEIELFTEDPFISVAAVPSVTFFSVRYPQPPVLIFPVDEDFAPPVFAVFTWTPVIGMPMMQFEYELLIVEILPGQTPLQAIEANREHLLINTRQPVFVYTQEHLPLEEGNEYAWQVTAREINDQVPIGDGGKSEIQTFTIDHLPFDIDPHLLTSIELVPDFAELIIDAEIIDMSFANHAVTLNGSATLSLDFSALGHGFMELQVGCHDLVVMMGGMNRPVVVGGEVFGDVRAEVFPHQGVGDIVTLEHIRYTTGEGLALGAQIIDPGGLNLEATGTLSLTPGGLYGQITATGHEGAPLFSFGVHPVELNINRITASFPVAWLAVDAQLRFFNEASVCQIYNLSMTETPASVSFRCNVMEAFPLIPEQEFVTLFLGDAFGQLVMDWEEQSLAFDITANGAIHLRAADGTHYDIPTRLNLSSAAGVFATVQPNSLLVNKPPLDLGIARMRINHIHDPFLAYDPFQNEWDFGIGLDADIEFPDFDQLRLPQTGGISIDRNGINFPGLDLEEDDLRWLPRLDFAGFGARLLSFRMGPLTFPWFIWDGIEPGPWAFSFDFELTTPNFRNHLPDCLRNLSLTVHEATFAGGAFTAQLPVTTFEQDECAIVFGSGSGVRVSQLGGQITASASTEGFNMYAQLLIDGSLLLDDPFTCDDTSHTNIIMEGISLSSDGQLSGTISGGLPACQVNIGPFEAGITNMLLAFQTGPSQQATLEADAFLAFPTPQGPMRNIEGNLGIDLVTGEFTALGFALDEPFVWNIPKDDPVLTFHVDQAMITLDGIFIDGRQTVMVGGSAIGVTFDNVLVDLLSFQLISGVIIFDETFALELGIDPVDMRLNYKSVPSGSNLNLDPGMILELAGVVRIDEVGLRAMGTAQAALSFAGIDLSPIDIVFSDDFAFGLDPFGVVAGEVEIFYDNTLVVVIDQYGFHPLFGAFDLASVLPERIPLPNHSVAYLQIKDQLGNLLIHVIPNTEDLSFTMSTLDGEPVLLVIPLLGLHGEQEPAFEVEFADVTFGINPLRFESGHIDLMLTHQQELDLSELGIPLKMKRISFGDMMDGSYPGLYLTGDLMLFNEQVDEDTQASLLVKENGTVEGAFTLSGLNKQLPLVPGSDLVTMSLESIAGELSVPLLSAGSAWFDFFIEGGFLLQHGDNYARADIAAQYNNNGFTITRFDFDHQESYRKPRLNIDPFIFQIDEIHSLWLSYHETDGFDFEANLSLTLGLRIEEDSLMLPFDGVRVRPAGLEIPGQYLHENSSPRLTLPPWELHGFSLQMIAFRTERFLINFYDLDAADFSGFIPRMDFVLTFPELPDNIPSLKNSSLTFSDVSYQDGLLNGNALFEPLNPLVLPIGNTEIHLSRLEGILQPETGTDGTLQQGIEVMIAGQLHNLISFDSDEPCQPADLQLSMIRGRGFSGYIDHFLPCGNISLGSLSLGFESASLLFDFVDDTQKALISGAARLTIPRQDQSDPLIIRGELTFDLVSGSIVDGVIAIDDPFNWSYPADAAEPFFQFTVQQARLDLNGLTMTGEGLLDVTPDLQVSVQFNDLLFGLDDLQIKDGHAIISSAFAFELQFLPVTWAMVVPGQPMPDNTNAIRLNLNNIGLILDKDGLSFTGESTAQFQFLAQPSDDDPPDHEEAAEPDDPGQQPTEPEPPDESDPDEDTLFDELELVFEEDFRLAFNPIRAVQGSANLYHNADDGPTRMAWYDTDGLHLGDIMGVLPIPDTLGLPNKEIAYMVLREGNQTYVETGTTVQGNTYLRTRDDSKVKIVIPALTDQNGEVLSFLTTFDIEVNAEWQPVSGNIQVQPDNPVQLGDYPLKITKLTYERRDNTPVLTASALLSLPESLKDLEIEIEEIRFSTRGFEQITIQLGTDGDGSGEQPLFHHAFHEDLLIINIFGVRLAFGEQNEFQIEGSIQSSFFKEEETNTLNSIPFVSSFMDEEWMFEVAWDEYTGQSLDIWLASLELTEPITIRATNDELSMSTSGLVTLPDLMGDAFSIYMEDLKISTAAPYFSVGEIRSDLGAQSFSLFNGMLEGTLTDFSPNFDSEKPALLLTLGGSLSVLGLEPVVFEDLVIGTDGTFRLKGEAYMNLLEEGKPIVIFEDYLDIEQIRFGMQHVVGENDESDDGGDDGGQLRLALEVKGNTSIPVFFEAEAPFTITAVQHAGDVDLAVQGPEFHFGEGFDIDEERPQVRMGAFATIDLRGLGLDLNLEDLSASSIYASAAIYLGNDTDKRIEIGNVHDPNKLKEEFGMRVSYDNGLKVDWGNVELVVASGQEFKIDLDLLFVEVTDVEFSQPADPSHGPFNIELAGNAGFNLKAISGTVTYEGFTFNIAGVSDKGRFVPPCSFHLLNNMATLELGSFTWFSMDEGDSPLDLTFTEIHPETKAEIQTTIAVSQYLHFGGGNGHALNLSINDGNIGGGVKEVLFYKEYDTDNMYLKVEEVSLNLNATEGFQATFEASLLYIREGNDFLFNIWGKGLVANVGFAGIGKVSTLGGQVSWGIFAEVTAPIILFPGIIELSSVGGGFFWRPDSEDIRRVYKLIDFELYNENALADLIGMVGGSGGADQISFAAFLTAGIGLVGTSGTYYLQGKTLLQVTNQYIRLDANTEMAALPNIPLMKFVFIDFKNLLLHGGIGTRFDYPGLLSGSADVQFVLTLDGEIIWAIFGGIHDLKVIPDLFTANGSFVIDKEGFLFEVNVQGGVNWKNMIDISANFDMNLWWQRDISFGAYAELQAIINAFGLVNFETTTYAGLLSEEELKMLLFFAGYVEASFLGLNTDIHFWVTAESPLKIDGAFGENQDLLQRIEEARNKRDEIIEASNELVDNLQEMVNNIILYSMTAEELTRAGVQMQENMNYLINPPDHPLSFIIRLFLSAEIEIWINKEETLTDPLPAGYQWVFDHIIRSSDMEPRRPDIKPLQDAQTGLEKIMEDITQYSEAMFDALGILESHAIEWRETALIDARELRLVSPPVTKSTIAVSGYEVPVFHVSEEAANLGAQVAKMIEHTDTQEHMYEEAIAGILANIDAVDQMIAGTGGMTVFGFADLLVEGLENVGRYFRLLSEYQWQYRDWSEQRYIALSHPVTISNIETNLNNERNLAQAAIDRNDALLVYDLIETRYLMLKGLAGVENLDAATQSYMGTLNDDNLLDELHSLGSDLWMNIHLQGLQALTEGYRANAEVLADHYPEIIKTSTHMEFTESLHRIYTLKSDLLAILYGIVDEYLALLGDDAADADKYAVIKSRITGDLEAPYITGLSANQQHYSKITGYSTITTPSGTHHVPQLEIVPMPGVTQLSWTATHPTGAVTESAFSVVRDGGLSLGEHEQLLSVGNRQSLLYHGLREHLNDMSHQYGVAVRVRGPGGRPATRIAQFEMAVNDGGTFSTIGADILPEVTSKPSPPTIELPYRRTGSYKKPGSGEISYWTHDPAIIDMTLSSYDEMASVTAFEFALGSNYGGRDIVGWTQAQGINPGAGHPSSGHANTVLETSMRNLQLQHNQPVYVSARARNNAGNYSHIRGLATPVIYDATPPSAPQPPEVTDRKEMAGLGFMLILPTVDNTLITEKPRYENPPYATPTALRAAPEINLAWGEAVDPESGIYQYDVSARPRQIYYYTLGGAPPSDPPADDQRVFTHEPSLRLTGGGLSYLDTLTIRVKAENHAGLTSHNELVLGPVVSRDPTPPTRPSIRCWVRPEGIRVYITQFSVDWETQVQGFQYAVGTQPGTDDIVAWPDKISFMQEPQAPGYVPRDPPYFTINTTGQGVQGIPRNKPIYVSVRAVNGQGMHSGVISNGPFVINSKPESPLVRINYSKGLETVTISKIGDAWLPLSDLQIRYLDPGKGTVIQNWRTVSEFQPGMYTRPATLNVHRNVTQPAPVKVEVRVVNTAGIQSAGSDIWPDATSQDGKGIK